MALQSDRVGTIRTVAYHGTPVLFDRFRVPDLDGVHFGSLDQASHRLCIVVARLPLSQFAKLPHLDGGQPGFIVQASIRMERPLRVPDQRTPEQWRRVIAQAKAEGYDGLVYRNEYETPYTEGDSYVVFSESQISDMNFPFNSPADARAITIRRPLEAVVELDGERIKVRVVDADQSKVVEYRDVDTDELIMSSEPIANESAIALDVDELGMEYLRDEADRREAYFSQCGR